MTARNMRVLAAYIRMGGEPLRCGMLVQTALTCLMGAQEFDVCLQLAVAAVLAVGHQVDGAVALGLDREHVALVLVSPAGGHPANDLQLTELPHSTLQASMHCTELESLYT